ncbi:hypothetical protein N657DRAFT_643088 [Parathielavia appendiculata]|uniref:Uncharacterized protein n=1 Tax=Parathielavia appendiculata TaxID=2587402 RepID=A0AAN6U795_9PEZI|nr:hypothetical protein N657DRAFT_643088 [Parathielavia appendiculata]
MGNLWNATYLLSWLVGQWANNHQPGERAADFQKSASTRVRQMIGDLQQRDVSARRVLASGVI